MKTIIVASTNPVKIESARRGFEALFPGESFSTTGVNLPSGVSDQPHGDAETLQGALNRARAAADQYPNADFCVGIEGGVSDEAGVMMVFAWIVVQAGAQHGGRTGKARTATFYLPAEVARLVRQGLELGDADDIVFGRSNSKQVNGSIGLLTGDLMTRADYYAHAVALALIPFKNPALTF